MTFYLFSYSYHDVASKISSPRYVLFDSEGSRITSPVSSISDIPKSFRAFSWETVIGKRSLAFFPDIPTAVAHSYKDRTYLGSFSTLADLTTLFPEHFL